MGCGPGEVQPTGGTALCLTVAGELLFGSALSGGAQVIGLWMAGRGAWVCRMAAKTSWAARLCQLFSADAKKVRGPTFATTVATLLVWGRRPAAAWDQGSCHGWHNRVVSSVKMYLAGRCRRRCSHTSSMSITASPLI